MFGGKALKETKTERKTTEQFYDIQSRLLPKLGFLGTELYILKFYHTKPDHGDLDVLVKIPKGFNTNSPRLHRLCESEIFPD